jgi:hypothetical protein
MMFEKAKPFDQRVAMPGGGLNADERARLRAAVELAGTQLPAPRPSRRAGEALRAVEWSELTARLNAARDLRLHLRTEGQAPIEAVAASFGDAAASYFALLGDGQPDINSHGLGQLKGPDANMIASDANRSDNRNATRSDAPRGATRDKR